MRFAPAINKANPPPRLTAPKANSTTISITLTSNDFALNAATPQAIITPSTTAGTISIWENRRVMTVAIAKTSEIASDKAPPMGEILPSSDSDSITAMPKITVAMAIHVPVVTFSRNISQASEAAINGPPACTSKILATLVYCSATTKAIEAVAKHRLTPSPGSPILLK